MIRPMYPTEIPTCVALIRESFATVAREFAITPENAPRFTAFATTEDRLTWQFQQGRPMFVFIEGEEIVGYFSLEIKGDSCELNNLCTHPAFRHRKIGGQLLAFAFAEANRRGCTRMEIGIVEENLRLRRWYEAHGFRHIGTKQFDFFPFTCGYLEREV